MRRGRAKVTREVTNFTQAPYRQKKNPFQPMSIFSVDEIESIHEASLKVLCDTGMDIQSPRAVEILKRGGASVDSDGRRVRFEPGFIMEKIATTPSEFTLHGRNKERHVHVGGQSIINTMVSSAPNVSDLDRGRILGNFEDYTNLIKLGEMLNTVHAFGGYPVEPCDLDVSVRHLKAVSAAARLTTKPLFGYAIGSERMLDVIEIVRISRGINKETLLKEPSITTVVNANSPLVYDKALLEGAIEMAEHNQPVIYTPFTLAGAMAPITVAGALVQQNAEALAGLAFHQCVKPGAPAMYGSFTSNVDMKSGSPAFGTPEYTQATIASGQLARKYKIPLRASNANASNAPDEQSVYESQMSLWACLLGQVNFILHGHGWIEGGLCASYEKVILDAEMNQMMEAFLQPAIVNKDTLGVEAIAEVGPANHFFAAQQTLDRYETEHYNPMLSDWRNFESWRDAGSETATQRANKIWKQLLEEYEEPKLKPEVEEGLSAFVDKRVAEGGAAPL
ncbi:trimethylamine methyltransferase family protein [Candidatus Thioglobus sp.]|jgi:trimethylamine--corrinoid protein Co-methyltransferase|nr:trimethylamine methyltransferase family protein [Candidatus Thioglobus sp.]MDB9866016.1 trimethylamine methyltransferase family protein [Candidatus Thioglobus sp.]MDB9937825.1 trimethylamine methyltransferase family protein [Candidatus Thioglobus sp.]MDC1535710.1 trimethylamine methyltransferase family protein [Candidatus Thioglobus sp.]